MARFKGTSIKEAQRAERKAKDKYVRVGEMMAMLECSESHAYKVMRQLNKELRDRGCITTAGRVSRKYLEERLYC